MLAGFMSECLYIMALTKAIPYSGGAFPTSRSSCSVLGVIVFSRVEAAWLQYAKVMKEHTRPAKIIYGSESISLYILSSVLPTGGDAMALGAILGRPGGSIIIPVFL